MKRLLLFFSDKSTIRVGSIYTIISFWDSFISMASGILMIRWIEPGQLGIWQSLTISQLYIGLFDLGISSGLNRELPYSFGKGNQEHGYLLAETTQYYSGLLTKIIGLVAIFTSVILYLFSYEFSIVAGVFVVGSLAAINFYDRYLTVTYRSNEAFLSLSKVTLIKTLFQILLLPLVFYFEYYGLILYSLLIVIIFVSLKYFNRPLRVLSVFRKEHFIFLFRTGSPVFIMNYLRGLTTTFNRVIILSFGGVLQVGLFTPVAAIGTMIDILPSILGNFFFPKMNIMLSKADDPKVLWPMAKKLNVFMIVLAVPFILIGWFVIPIIMTKYFPNYIESTKAMQLFTFNMLFAGTMVSHNVLYALKSYKVSSVFNISEIIVRLGFPALFVIIFKGNLLTLVVLGYLCSSTFLFFLNLYLIRTTLFKLV